MAQGEDPPVTAQRVPWAARIDPVVASRVRATVAGLQQLDPSFTAGRFTEQAMIAFCERMEAQFNDGRPWPLEPTGLRPGARLGP